MRLGLFAVALILIAAPAGAQQAPSDEGATTGESRQADAPKPDDAANEGSKKDESEKDESQNKEGSPPDDPLRFLRRQRNKSPESGDNRRRKKLSMHA